MQERHTLRDGTKVVIRPLKQDDASLYPDFLAEVARNDLRLRFFAAMREVSPDLIGKLVHYDPTKAIAFIAIEQASGKMLGVVRLHCDQADGDGEFAILVRSRLKGHGLGWLLMKHVIAYAKAEGMKKIHGQVLNENITMLAMCTELGFHSIDDPLDRGVKRVVLSLEETKDDALS